MKIDKAIKLLDEETTADEVRKLEYIAGFNREYVIEQIQEAMNMGAEALRKQVELQDKINILSLPFADDSPENVRKCVLDSLKSFVIEGANE